MVAIGITRHRGAPPANAIVSGIAGGDVAGDVGLVEVATHASGPSHGCRASPSQLKSSGNSDDSPDVSLRRSKDSEPESVVTEPVVRDRIPDAALDAIAAILRVLGETAVSDSQAASGLEAWARHILVLASPPGSGDAACHSRDRAGLSNHVVAYVRHDHLSCHARLAIFRTRSGW